MLCKVIAQGINVFPWSMALTLPPYTPSISRDNSGLSLLWWSPFLLTWTSPWMFQKYQAQQSEYRLTREQSSGKEVMATSCLICLIRTDDVLWYPPFFFHSFDTLCVQLNTYNHYPVPFPFPLHSFAAYSTDVKLRSGPFMAAVAPKKCLYRNGDLSP